MASVAHRVNSGCEGSGLSPSQPIRSRGWAYPCHIYTWRGPMLQPISTHIRTGNGLTPSANAAKIIPR